MSSTKIGFKAKVKIGDEIIPLASEIVTGDTQSKDGIEKGFLFKLDNEPGDSPVRLNLGEVIRFIENKLGVGLSQLQSSSGIVTLKDVFPGQVGDHNFNNTNSTIVEISNFLINSKVDESLFKISADLVESDPTKGCIPLPDTLSRWLKIDKLSISFSTNTKKQE